jgi:membrane-associated phospholipid phosphatase
MDVRISELIDMQQDKSLQKGGLLMSYRVNRHIVLVFVGSLLAGLVLTASAQMTPGPIEPGAGGWRTWVLASGQELRLAPPPDAKATATEFQTLRTLAGQRDAAALERIRYWNFWSPAHRWNEMLIDTSVAQNLPAVAGIRAFAMLNVALHDALIAAWDSKYAHNRRRPGETDAQLTTALPAPRSPSYPCEHSVAAGVGSAVLAHLFPKEAQRFTEAAEEASRSRVLAGVVYPSDARAGLDLGRAVAARVIEYLKLDETKYADTVPVGPGLWQGKDPIGANELRRWKPLGLASVSQFRPGPPPAPDSPERAVESAEVKNFKRTPVTNAKAFYWQFGQYGGPGLLYRLSDEIGRQLAEAGLDGNAPRAARAYALIHAAHYDAYIASQDAKYHYWTARPNQFDPSITTVIPTPNFPTYVSNAATLGMSTALVLGHLFPREANRYLGWAQEFGESRLWAGIHFRSDIEAGWEIGRHVGALFIERAQHDGAEGQDAQVKAQ